MTVQYRREWNGPLEMQRFFTDKYASERSSMMMNMQRMRNPVLHTYSKHRQSTNILSMYRRKA